MINQYLEKESDGLDANATDATDGSESNSATVGTQTSPTRSHNSSPRLSSDCERGSNGSFRTPCCSSESSSSLETVARTDLTPNSDSEVPVWVPRSEARGVFFDAVNGFGGMLDEPPPMSTSARSLPIADGVVVPIPTLRAYDRSRSDVLLARELGNKSSSAPVLKKIHQSADRLSSHGSKVRIAFFLTHLQLQRPPRHDTTAFPTRIFQIAVGPSRCPR